jgi:hypothetical protein
LNRNELIFQISTPHPDGKCIQQKKGRAIAGPASSCAYENLRSLIVKIDVPSDPDLLRDN